MSLIVRHPLLSAIALALCGSVALTGCRGNNAQRDQYIRELREQEDEIYALEDYLAEYQHKLQQERAQNARLREQPASQGTGSRKRQADEAKGNDNEQSLLDGPEVTGPDAPAGNGGASLPELVPDEPEQPAELPAIDMGTPATPAEPELPEIDLGTPKPGGEVEVSRPGPAFRVSPTAASLPLPGREVPSETVTPPIASRSGRVAAASIAVYCERLTGGGDAPGRREVLVMVEPLDAVGMSGSFSGELSVVLVDPSQASAPGLELARWDYTAEEAADTWRNVERRVLDLHLALPEETPEDRPLEVWVRLVPHRGGPLLAHTPIVIAADPALVAGGEQPLDAGTAAEAATGWSTSRLATAERSIAGEWKTSREPLARSAASAISAAEQGPAKRPTWSPER